jgi:hypothetical protein
MRVGRRRSRFVLGRFRKFGRGQMRASRRAIVWPTPQFERKGEADPDIFRN